MVREKVKVSTSTRTRKWKCVESRTDSKCLYYGRFILSPLMKGQVDTIGTAMRRALLRELEGTCITFAKSEKIPHEYSTIVEIVLRGNFFGTRNAFICAKGPGYVIAQDIILPHSVETVDNTQHVANLTKPIDLCIGLQIERNRGYDTKMPKNFHDRSYPIDVVFMPIRNVNHSIHCYGNDNEKQEILFLKIWTNGKEEILHLENNQHDVTLPFFPFHDRLVKLTKKKKKLALKSIFIDQSKLPPRIYNCLKKSNIHTLLDLLNNSREDLMKIEHFRIEDVKQILGILEKKQRVRIALYF
ncbi:hypothetical protein E1A91_D08G214600v1 [Gossypium mustelinum]|uniref:DNA-directed RNA polymerase RpoA/D/Rpb3-type domain-containing protein n=1 Tax=Gossypium mustelinum TaxID=34275 RepID=A0A5D2U113_GOSMU|nr:hypothetical protein E1A91_D08G214600v1 [Gossypium mustelinum]